VRAVLIGAAALLLVTACRDAGTASAPADGAAPAGAAVRAATRPSLPELTGRVVDQAALLTAAQEAQLSATAAELEQRTGDQLVIVTLTSLGGRRIEEVGLELGNRWGIGQRGRDNGVLLLVAPDERATRIEVGYGLEAILTNQRAQQIIDRDLQPSFRTGRWHAGIDAGADAIVAMLVAHAAEPRQRRR
jgi:uncharacterized protein